MTQFDNTNRGTLFFNNKKAADTHADYQGTINIEGTEYYINAWVKTPKAGGENFFSLSVKPKAAKPVAPKTDEYIPF